MATEVNELCFQELDFVLNDKQYFIRGFDLLARAWAYDEFKTTEQPDGVAALSERLSRNWFDLPAVTKTIYHLLVDKSDFGSYEKFLKAVEKDKRRSELIVMELYKTLDRAFRASEPDSEDVGEGHEIKKS